MNAARTFSRSVFCLLRRPLESFSFSSASSIVWDVRAQAHSGLLWDKILPPSGFHVLPKRWTVERTFSWLGQSRRLGKDYERLCETSQALIYATMFRLMARRLAQM